MRVRGLGGYYLVSRAIALLVGTLSCDSVTDPQSLVNTSEPVDTLVISNARGAATAPGEAASIVGSMAFVGIPQGTLTNGVRGVVRIQNSGIEAGVVVVDGGVTPVSVPASDGDAVTLDLTDASQAPLASVTSNVPRARRPRVVRSSPPRRKTDVPLNARITIVFSEPVDPTTLTPDNIRLMQGSTAISGVVQLLDPSLDASGISVQFVPSLSLQSGMEYKLVVTTGVRDTDGESTAAPDTIAFTVGEMNAGPPALIRLSPDSQLTIPVGSTFQVTATVLDAANQQLNDRPVEWSSSDPSMVSVSSSGELTAVQDGVAMIFARVDQVVRALMVTVRPKPAVSLTLSVTEATLLEGETLIIVPTARDAEGRTINDPAITWSSTQSNVARVANVYSEDHRRFVGELRALAQGVTPVLAASGTARAHVLVTVKPQLPSMMTVTTTTTGLDLDEDGYWFCIDVSDNEDYGFSCNEWIPGIATNGGFTTPAAAGTHTIWLLGLASNCSATGENPRSVTVAQGAMVNVPFDVTCDRMSVVVPYEDVGYRWKQVDVGAALPDFASVLFDDGAAGFATAQAAFGTIEGGCDLDFKIHTDWPAETDLLLRKTFTLPAGASDVRIAAAIDNDVQVFVNGVDVTATAGTRVLRGGFQIHGGCAELDSFVFRVPDNLLIAGTNLVAVRARDRGGLTYADLKVLAKLP